MRNAYLVFSVMLLGLSAMAGSHCLAASEPAPAAVGAQEPVAAQPAGAQSGTAQSGTAQSGTAQSGTAQSGTAQTDSSQSLASQSEADSLQSSPLLRLDVRRVPVDLVVLDKQGNPVTGLRKEDFTVKEDGNVQRIASFEATDGSVASFTPPRLPTLPANTFVNLPGEPERGPLYILYYDMVNTPEEDQMRFRRELLKFVDDAQPGTRMALFVNAAGLHMLQGFTADHALLRAAIERKGPGPHIPDVFLEGRTYGMSDWGAALSNLKFIAEYMNGLPGRKNLLWMASIFPIPVGPAVMGRVGATASQAAPSGAVGAQGGPQTLDFYALAPETIKRAYAAMMRSQIALYPVSVRGVVGGGDSGAGADALADYENMDVMASATGGHAYYSSNHPELLMDKAVAHGESYYTLSYAPTNPKFDGSERKIEVAMANKNGYTLTYRTVYYAIADDEPTVKKADVLQTRFLSAKASDTLYANIEHGAPMLHDLLFSAHLAVAGSPAMATPEQMLELVDSPAYFRTRHKDRPVKPLTPVKLEKYRIDYGVIDPQLKTQAKRNGTAAILEFAVAAYDVDGKLLNSKLNEGTPATDAKEQGKQTATFRAEQELEVPLGAASIRMAVRDKATDRTGTMEVPLPLTAKPASSAR